MAYLADRKPLKLGDFAKMRAAGDKIAMLTCYDSSFAALLDRAGVEVLLVGDSLGNVLQGHGSTLPVTMEHMEYHTGCVARGASRSFIIADMPFGSYQESPAQAMRNAARLMATGAHMVKLEGGAYMAETVRFLVERGVPVCAHTGLTPQAVNQLGGYRVQGATEDSARALARRRKALEDAGAAFMVIEMIPATLGAQITQSLATWPPSASAPGRIATVRCSCCTTCWACIPARSRASRRFHARRREHRGGSRGLCAGGEGRDVPRAGELLLRQVDFSPRVRGEALRSISGRSRGCTTWDRSTFPARPSSSAAGRTSHAAR
jgi:3-methyl-2-oxobutanoate hydroxymethyltransferase